MDLINTLQLTTRVVSQAGQLLKSHQESASRVKKSRKDFELDADHLSEEIILPILRKYFPDMSLYSEEAGGVLNKIGWLWIVDPLDGTWMYYKGLNSWGVSVALVEDGVGKLGVVALPGEDMIFSALAKEDRSHVSVGNRRISPRVSTTDDLPESLVWTDWTKRGYPKVTLKVLERLAQGTRYPCIVVSCTYSMMQVALGKIEGYVCPAPAPEDHAAAGLIVQKSGGRVTDMQGNPWSPFSKSIVATNGLIHDKLLDLLNK